MTAPSSSKLFGVEKMLTMAGFDLPMPLTQLLAPSTLAPELKLRCMECSDNG